MTDKPAKKKQSGTAATTHSAVCGQIVSTVDAISKIQKSLDVMTNNVTEVLEVMEKARCAMEQAVENINGPLSDDDDDGCVDLSMPGGGRGSPRE